MATEQKQIPFFTNLQCESALPWKDLTDELEKGLVKFSKGQVEQPVREMLEIQDHLGFLGKCLIFFYDYILLKRSK